MPITTHAELLTAVSDYIGGRSDLGSVDDDFVVLCEARLNHGNYDVGGFSTPPLRARRMQTRASVAVTTEYTDISSLNFLEPIYAKLTSTNPDKHLKALPQAMFDTQCPSSSSGEPIYYSIFGDELRIGPVQSVTVELGHYRTIPPLVSTDPNWLLTDNPGVYLYGALLEAAIYIDEPEDIQKFGRIFSGLVLGMQASGSDSSRAAPMQSMVGFSLPNSRTVRI